MLLSPIFAIIVVQNGANMYDDLLRIANRYAAGLQKVEKRKEDWIVKHDELKDHLTTVAENLGKQTDYKQGYFVDSMYAFDEQTKGTCKQIQSLVFRSGDMPMEVSFTSDKGERKEFVERGFQITFSPSVTGEIIVFLKPHVSDLNQKQPQTISLALFDEPAEITMADVDKVLATGMEMAYYTSFTGVADLQEQNNQPKPLEIPHHNPIGFTRYETTEKAK